jgi:hypothetical protein
MNDLGLVNVEQSLMYTTNVENRHDYVQTTTGVGVPQPAAGGRVRGIGAATLSRNFFRVHHPADNFNLDRATVASGPNAILFGLGSPAGILDATPARALMRNAYGFTLQVDSEDSKRATFDANTTLIEDEVRYRLPLEPFGDLFHFIIENEVRKIFDYREKVVSEQLQKPARE